MQLAARLDDIGKPAWITLMILGFIVFWPIGLGILAYLIWSGRMACWKHQYGGRWHHGWRNDERGPWRDGAAWQETAERWFGGHRRPRSSGNHAFDEYRMETLRRLEEEQREFMDFLERLRMAKDKAEFDEFLAERRRRPPAPPEAPEQPAPQA
ncbi:MAG TPA: DUF2852 domain-containing protein [Candidatus Cybelea sp.]|nr:DUF2852 domain-containing protein [Candidatus Cybelea sp.]